MNQLARIRLVVTYLINRGYAKSRKEIGQLLGYTNESSFSQILNGKVNTPKNFIKNLCSLDDTLSEHWLLTGEGEMIKSECTSLAPVEQGKVTLTKKINENNLVPLYELGAMKSLHGSFIGKHQIPIDYIYIPNVSACDGAVFVRGNSMTPYISAGDIVLFKHVKNIPEGVYFGEIYLISVSIDGDEYVAVNQVKKSENEEKMTLSSFNPDFKPQDIPIKAIKAMALVKAGIKYTSMV